MAFEIRTEYDEAHLEELQRVLDRAMERGIDAMTKKQHYILGGVMLVAGAIIATQGGLQSAFGVLTCAGGLYVVDHGRRHFTYTARKIRKRMPPAFTGHGKAYRGANQSGRKRQAYAAAAAQRTLQL